MRLCALFEKQPTIKNFAVLCAVAFVIRALTFSLYVQHEERYRQADTHDYHVCAALLYHQQGMVLPKSKEPIFWRTPGYPLYLAPFYAISNSKQLGFPDNTPAHKAAIWFQILLCSLLPVLIFFLALQLTQLVQLAWLAAWISVFHLGFVLASTFLLSDALASLVFVLFLIFFYRSFTFLYEPVTIDSRPAVMVKNVIFAALSLAVYTWMRPNGQFTVWVCVALLLFGACVQSLKLKKIGLFILVFFAAISPWYIRNYKLTGHIFFCPMHGPYLQMFSVPKILSRIAEVPVEVAHGYAMYKVDREVSDQKRLQQQTNPDWSFSKEYAIKHLPMPFITGYPLYFLYDWFAQVIITTFDIYGSQLVKFADGSYRWDPMQEFLVEKFQKALYQQPMPLGMRLIIWLEFLWELIKVIGLFCGVWIFLLSPLVASFNVDPFIKKMGFLWLKTGILIGASVMQTGGYGYARLRLPIEPLMIILCLTYYFYIFRKYLNNQKAYLVKE